MSASANPATLNTPPEGKPLVTPRQLTLACVVLLALAWGFLPEFTECVVCGRNLNGDRAYFHALADGVMCADDKRLASSELSAESRGLAARMFRAPVDAFSGMSWPKSQAADLRKLLIQILQRHIEKNLVTAGMLERVD